MPASLSLRRNRAALRALTWRFVRNRRGVAAIEFAILLPVMMVLYMGAVDLGQGVMADRKTTALTRALADLSGQATLLSTAEISNVFDAANMVMSPFNSPAAAMSIVHIVIDDKSVARVCWSEQRNSSAPARGTTITIPTDLRVANTSLIMARASYTYTPLGYAITGALNLGNNPVYVRPRLGKAGGTLNIEQIERSGVGMCPNFS
jgi:Flp pilus assembly protein TadG